MTYLVPEIQRNKLILLIFTLLLLGGSKHHHFNIQVQAMAQGKTLSTTTTRVASAKFIFFFPFEMNIFRILMKVLQHVSSLYLQAHLISNLDLKNKVQDHKRQTSFLAGLKRRRFISNHRGLIQ
ncbi:uncharacterized protein LOC120006245 isoform X2 [Tripterygium wilfordii]|uniref:uncharacterized protein LOC120006245 isoform X2 n=1 Tax=Tripterygium wilfordii TaxID=458696 RepID=UPI0018F82DAF|nr:uncharacterized protein LOC120006245 isoform X2 [Tripterygium wilfordii]